MAELYLAKNGMIWERIHDKKQFSNKLEIMESDNIRNYKQITETTLVKNKKQTTTKGIFEDVTD